VSFRYPTIVYSPESLRKFRIGTEEATYLQDIANREIVGLPEDAKSAITERAKTYNADEVLLTSMPEVSQCDQKRHTIRTWV
jgi:hypothetical protein